MAIVASALVEGTVLAAPTCCARGTPRAARLVGAALSTLGDFPARLQLGDDRRLDKVAGERLTKPDATGTA